MDRKKLKKSIESIEKQREKHKDKINSYDGKNYALLDYWEKEIKQFDDKIHELKEELGKKGEENEENEEKEE